MSVGAGLPSTFGRPLRKTSTQQGRVGPREQAGRQCEHRVEQSGLDDALPDAAGAAALEECAVRQNDDRPTVIGKVGEAVLNPCGVAIVRTGLTPHPARIVGEDVSEGQSSGPTVGRR